MKRIIRLYPITLSIFAFSVAVSIIALRYRAVFPALAELLLGLALTCAVFFLQKQGYDELKAKVEAVNEDVTPLTGGMNSLPLPAALCDSDGALIWFNELFKTQVIGKSDVSPARLKSFLPKKDLVDMKTVNVLFAGKRYSAYVKASGGATFLVLFCDDTKLKNDADELRRIRPVVISIAVDGMEDVSSKISGGDYSELLGDTEQIIYEWFEKFGCRVRKTGEGRFFSVLETSVFNSMKEDGFSLLKSVREHSVEDIDAKLTLSIGVGVGASVAESDTFAVRSIDMARSRGGDQAAIYKNGGYEFIGGISQEVQSRSRVRARTVAAGLEKLIRTSESVLIMGHRGSDLDAVGSALGLAQVCATLGKRAHVVLDDETTMARSLVKYCRANGLSELFVTPAKAVSLCEANTLVMVTDVMRPGITDCPAVLDKSDRVVVIDHHRMSVDGISDAIISYVNSASSSACEMVAELMRYMSKEVSPTKIVAEALLSGIYLDTKDFTIRTGVRTFEAAAYLKEHGADTVAVRKLFASTVEENSAVAEIASKAVIKGAYAYAVTDREGPDIRLVASRAADELLKLENVDASFVIYKNGDSADISARSYGTVNVQLIMESLGGGGHHTMAAAQLKGKTTYEALEELLKINNKEGGT